MSQNAVGVDIEEVKRFKALVRNRKFMDRVFTKQEIAYCSAKKRKLEHFAVRFAAKEAVWKALSDFLRGKKAHLGHRDIGVKNDAFGKPQVVLPKAFSSIAKRTTLSLSHTSSYAVAVAFVTAKRSS